MVKPLELIDIVLSIYNQEEIIERVLYGIFKNTTTPFNLILIFDGCTDRTKPRALSYIKKINGGLLKELIIKDTPNLFELRANNVGFKLAREKYLITLQDDMVIDDYGWERRLTYPLRQFDDILAVTGRGAQNIETIGNGKEKYTHRSAREFGSLPRNMFAIRDVINRGPIAFRTDYLKELQYLNDAYAPGALDDAEISLRAWRDKHWKVGAFWINYISKQEWSKVNAPDSTMKAWESWGRNNNRLYEDFKEYLDSGDKHTSDFIIEEFEIDYSRGLFGFLKRKCLILKYPLRIDMRVIKNRRRLLVRRIIKTSKFPFLELTGYIFGTSFKMRAVEQGFKKALISLFKKNS
ncbi:MAG: glycosyltransferase family A protein [Patescibacteria group bacterium]